jgi:flagellar biosynthetic protein FliR
MAMLPLFGDQAVPARIRLFVGVAFTAAIAPLLEPSLPAGGLDLATLLRYIATETVCGFALGFSVRLLFWMLQIAGTIAAQATSLSQLLGGAGPDPQPAIAQIMLVAGMGLAAISGLHYRIAEALVLSYRVIPMGEMIPLERLGIWAGDRITETFAFAFVFAAPFLIGSLLYNLALGVINRAMPQLMVAFVGAPVITLAGLVLLMLSLPVILPVWLDMLNARLADPFGAPQ